MAVSSVRCVINCKALAKAQPRYEDAEDSKKKRDVYFCLAADASSQRGAQTA
jgi:hypothetical protein